MALTANKIPSDPVLSHQTILCRSHEKQTLSVSTVNGIKLSRYGIRQGQQSHRCLLAERSVLSNERLQCLFGIPFSFTSKKSSFLCKSLGANNTEEKECDTTYGDGADISSGMMSMEARARKDVAFLGTKFLKLDARAREDTERIDREIKEKAKHLHHIATILKNKAESRLKSAAAKHWSDGALKADLHLADFRAKQRAMEDALMALECAKNIHDMMVNKMYKVPLPRIEGSQSANNVRGFIMLQKNGKAIDFFPGDVSTDRIRAVQEAYWSMASALSEADGIDYTDPEELELLITTLIDLDAMDGKQSVSLLVECSSSPDVSIRQALANALAKAPSMWALGNAGMGALQRLAEDSSPAVAAAASRAIYKLKKRWEIEECYNRGKQRSRESDDEEYTY